MKYFDTVISLFAFGMTLYSAWNHNWLGMSGFLLASTAHTRLIDK